MSSFRSPKNKYRVEVSYKRAVAGLGSVQSFTTDDLEGVDGFIRTSSFMAKQDEVHVKILENKKQFPEFDWQMVKSYNLHK